MDRSKFLDIVQPLLKDKTDDYKIALRDDEVLKLWNYQPKDNNDEIVRDIFLLNCLTGQRISDTEKVDDNLEDILDVTTIKLIQKKTGKYLNFSIIFELAKEILNKYPNGLPKVNTQTLNSRIKEIAKEAGITGKEVVGRQTKDGLNTTYKERYECITTHTGRRTFITLLKLRGWDDGKITMYSGHKDDRMVKRYTKIKDTAAFERFNKTKKEHPELLLRMVGEEPVKIDDTNNIAYQFGKAFSKLEDEHKEDIKKVSFNKEIDKAFSIINNDIDTTDFLLTNGVNEKDIIELMKHKGMMPEDIEVTYDKDSKAILKLK